MTLLEVDTIGLRMLAALSCQATSAAVAAVHADVSAVAQSLADRTQSTAAKLNAASVDYAVNEADSATRISALTIAV